MDKSSLASNTALTCTISTPCTKAPILVSTPLTLSSTSSSKSMHCPHCNSTRTQPTQTDIHHMQAINSNLPYIAIKTALTLTEAYIATPSGKAKASKLGIPNPNLDPVLSPTAHDKLASFENILTDYLSSASQSTKDFIVHIQHMTCATCGTYSTIKTTSDKPMIHCPFCGSTHIALNPSNISPSNQVYDSFYAWEVLNQVTSIPVPALQVLYNIWLSDKIFAASHTFNQFLVQYAQLANTEMEALRHHA